MEARDLKRLQADDEDYDQPARMIGVFVGRTCNLM